MGGNGDTDAIGVALQRTLDLQWSGLWFFRLMACTHATGAVALGTVLWVGGYPRMSSPSFDLIRGVPHAPAVWGAALIACGVLVLLSIATTRFALRTVAFLATAVVYGLFAVALTSSVASTPCGPDACPAFTGTVSYLLIATLSLEHAALAWVARRLA